MPCLAWLGSRVRGELSANKSHEVNDAGQLLVIEWITNRHMRHLSQQLAGDRSTICGELFMLGAPDRTQASGYCIREVTGRRVC